MLNVRRRGDDYLVAHIKENKSSTGGMEVYGEWLCAHILPIISYESRFIQWGFACVSDLFPVVSYLISDRINVFELWALCSLGKIQFCLLEAAHLGAKTSSSGRGIYRSSRTPALT